MTVKTRFAPSPTGYLHIGNVRTALINYLFAKKHSGDFMLRMDDTDIIRSKPEYEEAIISDLNWLGMKWNSFERQSARLARYDAIKEKLLADGRLYPCYETQEELEIKRKMQLSRSQPPIYDRASLNLTAAQLDKYRSENRKPHYRFKLLPEDIFWDDMVRGENRFHGSNLSDPILIREDGSMTYILCSVVDDIDFGITHVIRGEDHVSNTAIQIQIFKALGADIPIFGHLNLITSKTKEISKRLGGFDIKTLRENDIEAMSILSMFAKIGTSDPIEVRKNIEELIEEFDISKFSRSPANYDEKDLEHLNHKLVANLPFEEVKEKLQIHAPSCTEYFWEGVKGNINKVSEISLWWNICNNTIKPIIENEQLLQLALEVLPESPWDEGTWGIWIDRIKAKTDIKGKQLFMPLRKALTGLDYGPELKILLPIMGHTRVKERLKGNEA